MKSATMKDALGSVAADRTAAVFKACQEWESELAQLSDSKLLSKVKVSREDSLKTVDELRVVMQQVKCDVSESEKGMIEALMSENLTGPGVRALKVLTNALRAAARLIEEKDFLVVSAIEKYILLERKLALLEAETEEQRLMWKRRRNLFHQQCIALSRCGQRHLLPAGVARPDPMMRREVSKWLARNAYGDNKNKYPCVMMDRDLPAPKRRARKPQLATEDSAQKTPDLEKTSSPFRQANAGAQMGDSLLIDDSKLLPPTQPAENTEPQSAHPNVRDDSKFAPPNRPAADAQKDDSAVSDDGAKVSGNPEAHAKASPGSPQAASPFVHPCGPPAANPCAAPMGPWGNLDADTAYWWYMQNKLWQEAQEWYDHDWAPAMMASWSDEREFTPPYPLSPMPPPASSQPFGPWWGPPSCDKWADDTGYPPDMRYFHHGTMSETQAADEYMVPGYTDTPPPPTKLYKESGTDAPKRMMTAEAQTAAPTSVSEAQTTRQMVAPAAHTQQPPMGQPTPSRSLPVMPLFGNGSEKYVNSQQRSEPGSPGNDAHSDAKSREVARARMEDEIRRKKRELGLSTNTSVGTSEALPQRRESAQPVTSGRALEDSTMPRISTQSKFGTRLEVPSHSQPGRRRSDDATTALSAPRLVLSDAAPASPVSHHTRPTEHRPEQPASRDGNTQLERDEEHRTHGRTLAESSPKNQEAFYDTTGMPRVDSPRDTPELYRDSFYENDNATYHRLRSGAGATDQYYRPNAPYPGTDPIDQYYSPNAPYAGADPTYQHHPPNAAYADSDATDQYYNPSGTYQDAGVTDQYYSPSGPYQDASATERYYRPNGPNQDIHETDQYYRPNAPYADRGASSYYRPSGELAGPADPDHRSNPNTERSAPTRQPAPTSSNSSRLRQNSNDELNSNYTNERSAYTQKPPPTSSNTSRSWQDPNDDLRSNRTSESSAYDQHSRPTIATSSSKPTPRLGLPPAKTSTPRRGASSRNQDLMAPPSTAQRTSRNAPSSAGSTGSRRTRLHARGVTGTATYAF